MKYIIATLLFISSAQAYAQLIGPFGPLAPAPRPVVTCTTFGNTTVCR